MNATAPAVRPAPVPGPLLFARFAFPPNALGYCGPDDPRSLLEHAASGTVDRELEVLARGFDGAWPYLQLIAHANGIADPLDRAVVEAYWIGNALLEQVPAGWLATSLDERFRRRAGRRWDELLAPALAGAAPHHNLHVLGVSPWIGLLRGGAVDPALTVLDQCRIRDGQVVAIDGDQAVVRSRRLVWEGERLWLGPPALEQATLATDGLSLTEVAVGDWVALHWDWVCHRLDEPRRRALRHWTERTLAATASTAPTPQVHNRCLAPVVHVGVR